MNMSVDLQSLLNLMWFAVCLAEAQLFEQPLTNLVYTTHIQRGSAGRNGKTAVDVQRAPIQIIEPAQLHQQLKQITGSETLAPLLYNLLGQTVPNWQTPTNQPQQPQQQQFQQPQRQQQQQRQHFFVYESPQPVRLVSQQPQILPGFNGVNVHLQQQQQPLSLPKPIQAQQQYPQTEPKIVKAPPAIALPAPNVEYSAYAPAEGTQLLASSQVNATEAVPEGVAAACIPCCSKPSNATATSSPSSCSWDIGCCGTTPLLSATALKAAVG